MLVAAAGALHVARSQSGRVPGDALLPGGAPEAELHIARMIYASRGGRFGFGGFGRPWWAIDYPEAEYHFRNGVRRLTRIDIADDSRHLRLTDEAIFDHPWMFAQQVGRWALTDEETLKLREYLMRGGFLVADDFHGPYEWEVFAEAMQRVFPDRPIVDIPEDDPILHVLYDLDERTQIPGRRHLRMGPGGEIYVLPDGTPPRWRGIYDDAGRLMVVINFNMDMGDAWEHADDPVYPEPMTALAYRFGINYVVYAMTH
ncbi:MAG: DUF4159 domain-containing protein [Pseudomonadota bacterium]